MQRMSCYFPVLYQEPVKTHKWYKICIKVCSFSGFLSTLSVCKLVEERLMKWRGWRRWWPLIYVSILTPPWHVCMYIVYSPKRWYLCICINMALHVYAMHRLYVYRCELCIYSRLIIYYVNNSPLTATGSEELFHSNEIFSWLYRLVGLGAS